MEIKTLKDIKKAIKDIPDEVLERFGCGIDPEGESEVQLLCWGDDQIEYTAYYQKMSKKYPQLDDINEWVINIGKEAIKGDAQDDSVFDREEPISSEDKL